MSLEQGRQEAVVLKHGVENQTIEGETSSKRLKTEPATEPEIVEAQPSIAEVTLSLFCWRLWICMALTTLFEERDDSFDVTPVNSRK